TANDPEALARRIMSEGLSVRDAERLSQSPSQQASAPKAKSEKDADLKAMEISLSDAIGMKVLVDHGARGGTVTISYKSLEQLDVIEALLRRK
ncbi:MAG: ParB/RepB/Spo0J family partition protein, partial [Notoacmeibacter sp.]